MRIAHVVVRDQLAVCHFFSRKTEYEKDEFATGTKSSPENRKKERNTRTGTRGTMNLKGGGETDDYVYDEIFDDTNDLFFLDDGEKSFQ